MRVLHMWRRVLKYIGSNRYPSGNKNPGAPKRPGTHNSYNLPFTEMRLGAFTATEEHGNEAWQQHHQTKRTAATLNSGCCQGHSARAAGAGIRGDAQRRVERPDRVLGEVSIHRDHAGAANGNWRRTRIGLRVANTAKGNARDVQRRIAGVGYRYRLCRTRLTAADRTKGQRRRRERDK